MQPASRRVKTIYSVIASPTRLEILRILNTKGPLSYSELKTLTGFKSKKESGKFAYHLRKLVRQMLISLNRSERKYTVTNLGRLVLNLTRQIEEQSVMESGKLYVRTSRHTMEEFDSDKILQSLVREAGMPVEVAQKITSETEARLYKFQTTYLTAPLIREMVNALLIEYGYEEYRHRLTRLGLPVYDVTELMKRVGEKSEGINNVLSQTSNAVFSEYLLLAQLPRDVADAHLSGDINISNAGSWGLIPDTVFVDPMFIQKGGVTLAGKLMNLPRLAPPRSLDEAVNAWITSISLLAGEVSVEISFENFMAYLAEFLPGRSEAEAREVLRRGFLLVPSLMEQGHTKPVISIHLDDPSTMGAEYSRDKLSLARSSVLLAYGDYVDSVPMPRTGLLVSLQRQPDDPDLIQKLASIVNSGGRIGFEVHPKITQAYTGIKRSLSEMASDAGVILHALSVNLPRLAYDSNKDETYFRAKLALLLQLSVNALATRRKILVDVMKRGLLPALAHISGAVLTERTPLAVNMVGLNEAVFNLIGEKNASSARRMISEKIVETAVKITGENAEKLGGLAGAAATRDDSAVRFATLDTERYGRTVSASGRKEYSQTPRIPASMLSSQEVVQELNSVYGKLNGGYSLTVDLPQDVSVEEVASIINEAANSLDCFKLNKSIIICRNCGSRMPAEFDRCRVCRSASVIPYQTAA